VHEEKMKRTGVFAADFQGFIGISRRQDIEAVQCEVRFQAGQDGLLILYNQDRIFLRISDSA
ncbi:MAG: hypothetical protein ACREI3_09855, partial [Nitrospirales bacterium]